MMVDKKSKRANENLPTIAEKCIEVAKTSRLGPDLAKLASDFPYTHFWRTWGLAGHIWQALLSQTVFSSFCGAYPLIICYILGLLAQRFCSLYHLF